MARPLYIVLLPRPVATRGFSPHTSFSASTPLRGGSLGHLLVRSDLAVRPLAELCSYQRERRGASQRAGTVDDSSPLRLRGAMTAHPPSVPRIQQ